MQPFSCRLRRYQQKANRLLGGNPWGWMEAVATFLTDRPAYPMPEDRHCRPHPASDTAGPTLKPMLGASATRTFPKTYGTVYK